MWNQKIRLQIIKKNLTLRRDIAQTQNSTISRRAVQLVGLLRTSVLLSYSVSFQSQRLFNHPQKFFIFDLICHATKLKAHLAFTLITFISNNVNYGDKKTKIQYFSSKYVKYMFFTIVYRNTQFQNFFMLQGGFLGWDGYRWINN
jgi:hypothetical protein